MHAPLLALLTLLFALRVLGQALVAFLGVTWLPAMDQWFSGVIAYPAMLVVQLLMLLLMVKITGEVWSGTGFYGQRRAHWSPFLIKFSAVYAAAMALRYALTMILHPEMRWFGHVIPIIFHFVLAGFIFALGHYHKMTAKP
jgi:hypothetical protein